MKFTILSLGLLLALGQADAQRVQPDELKTAKGALTIQPIEHATLLLTAEGKTIYVDPTGGVEKYKGFPAPDLIVITDIHGDHFDQPTIDAIKTAKTTLIVPAAVASKLSAADQQRTVVMKNGDKQVNDGFTFTAIPMYNLPESPDAMHTKGRGNGYVIEIGKKRIYISGDTGGIPEMKSLKNIDVAFVCMNLPYTMNVDQAAEAVLAFKPKIVYPYHYRGKDGFSDVHKFKALVNAGDKQIEVRLKDWYQQ
ncbi:MBL fold metallo-hydrolase [Chitinophaga sp. 30R24]|uniref:MBL fold metallo-hydrolase n=1 Tax=Chitinophaga sp. 30R24 TaxID=3248838 RepID=UPI003B8F3C4E